MRWSSAIVAIYRNKIIQKSDCHSPRYLVAELIQFRLKKTIPFPSACFSFYLIEKTLSNEMSLFVVLLLSVHKSGCTTTETGDVTQTLGTRLLKMCLSLEVGASLLVFRNQLCLLAKKKACSTCSLLLSHSFLGAASPSSSLRQEAVMSSGILWDSHPHVFSSPH